MARQLDMTPDMKRRIFEAHFNVAQINERVIAQFQDMKRDGIAMRKRKIDTCPHVMLLKMSEKSPSNRTSFLGQRVFLIGQPATWVDTSHFRPIN